MEQPSQSIVAVPPKSGRRRSFSRPFKRALVEQTLRADVSVAGVALANGVNANLLSRWRREHLTSPVAGKTPALIPVHLVESQGTPSLARTHTDDEIEIRCRDACVIIRGAPDKAMLSMVLRELLQSGSGSSK